MAAGAGMKVVRSVTVRRSAGELFRLWRDLASLPQFMTHLVSVKEDGFKVHVDRPRTARQHRFVASGDHQRSS